MNRALAPAVLLPLLAGCKPESALGPDVSPLPDLSGRWSYVAMGLQLEGSPSPSCGIDGMTLRIGPWESRGFEGRASGGVLRCQGELSFLSGQLPEYPIRRGGMSYVGNTVYPYVAFDISNERWRHDGVLSHDTVRVVVRGDTLKRVVFGDTMSGPVTIVTGGVRLDGRFRAVRESRR